MDIARHINAPAHDKDIPDVFANTWIEAQRLGKVGMRAADEDQHWLRRVVNGIHNELSCRDGF